MIRKTLFIGAFVVSTAAAAAPARHFLDDAIKGDNSETRLGQLIASRGASPAVRSFGETLASDHTQARAQAASVARRMSVAVPGAMMPEARSEYAKLQHLRGAAFDREVKRYMINDHQNDIAKFQAQARSGDRQTADLARAQLPTLRKHLRIAESLRV
jgi:putative membrane protein